MSNLKPWEINKKFSDAIEAIAISSISKFYPSYISKTSGLPINIIIDKLDEYANDGALTIKFEFICIDCSRSILTLNEKQTIDFEFQCKYCGTENHFDALDAIPFVELNKEFKQSFSKKKALVLV